MRRGRLRCLCRRRHSGRWCIISCRALYSSVLVTAWRAQLGVWIFCVRYCQVKARTVISIQLLLLALELVALCCIACNAGRQKRIQSAVSLCANGGQLIGFVYIQRVYCTAVQVLQVDDTVLGKASGCCQVRTDLGCLGQIISRRLAQRQRRIIACLPGYFREPTLTCKLILQLILTTSLDLQKGGAVNLTQRPIV